ncbi:hypothetical protein L0Y59_04080 [Candidatus Uhrbacteria bacterium]|nr:hypothetical protein [Candidatus Uhrbacteria bacterium]
MKLVLMTHYVGYHDEVMGILRSLGIRCYTRWREVEGQCSCGEAHDGTQVWPGLNTAVMVVVDAEKARALLAALSRFNRTVKEGGVDAYVVDVADSVLAGGK